MTKTVEYILIGGAVVVGVGIIWTIVKPNPQIPVNSNPVQPSGTSLTDILSASIRGIVAGIGDSERVNSNGMSPVPPRPSGNASSVPIWYLHPDTYGGARGYGSR